MEIREVQRQDDLQIEALIRSCLKEYNADKPDVLGVIRILDVFLKSIREIIKNIG